MAGNFIGAVHQGLKLRRDGGQVPQKAQADLIALHRVDGLQHILLQKAHNDPHLVGGTLPVLRREGVHRQVFHPQILAIGGDLAEGLGPYFMSGSARQAALLRPTTVAVHDDGYVSGNIFGVCLIHSVTFD